MISITIEHRIYVLLEQINVNQTVSEQTHLKNRTDLKLHFIFIIDCFSGRDL